MKYIFILPFLFLLTACGNNRSDSDTTLQSTSSDSTTGKRPGGYEVKQLAGVFYDTLPCADCPGIATKVYLKPDNTFVMEQEYVGKNTFYQTGIWQVTDSLLQLIGTSSPQRFKIINYAELELLDTEGKEINSPKKLELYRNNIPFKPMQAVPVEGVFSAKNDTMNIHICSMQRDYPATLAPTAMILTSKYKQAAKDGEPIYAKLAGHFELRPSLNDTTTQDFFVVEKFIKFDPKQQCK